MLKIYNTLTRTKEEFKPITPGKVGMYVCGMTVYDYCHIGHARVMVVFDTVARYFDHLGYDLTYVRNVTDIDDKIINRANEAGEDYSDLTRRFIECMHEDERALNVTRPKVEPRATQSMDAIIKMILQLFEHGLAYTGSNGDVFYPVSKFKDYGRLSGKKLEDLQAGERVEVDKAKKDPLDFVLWKKAKPGEPYWNSPWGRGRPGWHIECSAMSTCCLGNHFDIHGGGMDLQFPHHENEIAQSEGATGEKFVNLWMHNGFVRVDDEKMSKSLGNFFTVREVLKQYEKKFVAVDGINEDFAKRFGGEIIRFFILNNHYRSPLNYSDLQLEEAEKELKSLYKALVDAPNVCQNQFIDSDYKRQFEEAMNDDFNTRIAISVLFKIRKELNRAKENSDSNKVEILSETLRMLGSVLGILENTNKKEIEAFLQSGAVLNISSTLQPLQGGGSMSSDLTSDLIEQKIKLRAEAKKNKDWATADRIRDELKAQGVILEDGPSGTTWRRE
ncbi:MAG: cysteine--tRNA ligase [Gammaproteobacteria bacterium]